MKGYYSEEALAAYAELVAASADWEFSEGDTYDFTRCVRPDGSAYGTRGKCKKGTEGAKEVAAPTGRAPADHGARVAKHQAEYEKHAAAHKAAKEELKAHRGRDLRSRVKRQELAIKVQTHGDKRDKAPDNLMKAKRAKFAAEQKGEKKEVIKKEQTPEERWMDKRRATYDSLKGMTKEQVLQKLNQNMMVHGLSVKDTMGDLKSAVVSSIHGNKPPVR